MGEVQDELDRALLEDGTARVTEGMVFRDVYRDYQASKAEREQRFDQMAEMYRTTPARPYRVRVHLDPVDGPIWLGLLAQCAWLRGGILGGSAPSADTWAGAPRTPAHLIRQ